MGLVLGHTPKEGAAVTGVYDRHTYVPEKRKALEVWANHLCGEAPPKVCGAEAYAGEGAQGAASSQVLATYVEAAKARAMALCAAGDLHGAVLGLCMELSRRSETAGSHLDILARGGMELAISGSRRGVEAWVTGFR